MFNVRPNSSIVELRLITVPMMVGDEFAQIAVPSSRVLIVVSDALIVVMVSCNGFRMC